MTEEAKLPQRHSALLVGEAGIVFTLWRLAPSDELAGRSARTRARERRQRRERAHVGRPRHAARRARAAGRDRSDDRWRDAVRESEEDLRASARRGRALDAGSLRPAAAGSSARCTGSIGNVLALGEPGNVADVLARTAVVEGEHANWPPSVDGYDSLRLQWCHGAPGILIHAAEYLDEDLLLAGAQLVWDAGPLGDEKGFGICHGTAGNGYALLKTFERTGDERWLERARAFAVHALEQAERMPARYTLFTGGVGAALFARTASSARAAFPVLEDLYVSARPASASRPAERPRTRTAPARPRTRGRGTARRERSPHGRIDGRLRRVCVGPGRERRAQRREGDRLGPLSARPVEQSAPDSADTGTGDVARAAASVFSWSRNASYGASPASCSTRNVECEPSEARCPCTYSAFPLSTEPRPRIDHCVGSRLRSSAIPLAIAVAAKTPTAPTTSAATRSRRPRRRVVTARRLSATNRSSPRACRSVVM